MGALQTPHPAPCCKAGAAPSTGLEGADSVCSCRRVLHQPSLAHLHQTELAPDRPGNGCSTLMARIGPSMLSSSSSTRPIRWPCPAPALARAHGHDDNSPRCLRLFAFGHPGSPSANTSLSSPCAARWPLRHVVDVGRRADHPCAPGPDRRHANVGLHAKVPLVCAFRSGCISRSRSPLLFLRSAGRGDQGGINGCAALEQQPLAASVLLTVASI